jgi:SAM-dependent methyltransferase
LSSTPIHPQWFSFRAKVRTAELVAGSVSGALLDVGSGDGGLRRRLSGHCKYVGLDSLATGREFYDARPDVYGDAARLPFRDASFDAVALLDVLEHLGEPRISLREALRVLKPGGALYISVPCMYPLHDEPYDFQRPTLHGLRHWLESAGFRVVTLESRGEPLETTALLANIALARVVSRAMHAFLPAALLFAFIVPLVPIVNLLGWLFGRLGGSDGMMPFGYWAVARRPIS